jgi:hypothetical protein
MMFSRTSSSGPGYLMCASRRRLYTTNTSTRTVKRERWSNENRSYKLTWKKNLMNKIWGSHDSYNNNCCVLSGTWCCVAWYKCMDISKYCAATYIRVHNNDGEGSRNLSNVGTLAPDHLESHSRRWKLSS